MPKLDLYLNRSNTNIINGVCPHDCPDTCAWQVAVDTSNGQALDIWGHPDHAVTQGVLCGKVDRYLERSYHASRLTTPLKRVGPKGKGEFTAISWDKAIGEIAANLKQVIAEFGPEAVLPYSYAGTMGLLQGEGMAQRFLNRMGASKLAATICSEAGSAGYKYTIGRSTGLEPQDFAHARFILIWGSNTLSSNMHLWPFVQQARRQGARVIVIDPTRTRTARAADEWIPIRPGTDGALALALMHVIIGEDLYDEDYVDNYTVGFEPLVERVKRYSPEWAAEISGVASERIRLLARAYAATQPSAIRINYGLQRHAGGGMAVRNIACLPALTGAWRHQGGGMQLSTSGTFPMDFDQLKRPELLNGRAPREINMNRLGDALSLDPNRIALAHHHPRPVAPRPTPDEAGPPVKALIVFNSNPAAVSPDQRAVLEGLHRSDLYTVVLEHFQTDTADYADIVLPATTQLEHWDILTPYGHMFIALNRPAITPIGQSQPNSGIFRRLAAAMGYEESCFGESDEQILQDLIQAQTHPHFEGMYWERLLEQGFVRLNLPEPYLPFAKGNFYTPSGRCEFYSESAAADGYDPLPVWTPPKSEQQDWNLGRDERFGHATTGGVSALKCISPPAHSFLNSSFVNLERFNQREGQPLLCLHPQDAEQRRIGEGDRVRVRNDLGSVSLIARITEDIIPGTVLAPSIWWNKLSIDGANINQITPQDEADMGAGALFYDVRVWVERVEV